MSELRQYIVERDADLVIQQYLETMTALLYKLQSDVENSNLDSNGQKVLEDKVRDLLLKKVDYTKPGERSKLIKSLSGQIRESYIPEGKKLGKLSAELGSGKSTVGAKKSSYSYEFDPSELGRGAEKAPIDYKYYINHPEEIKNPSGNIPVEQILAKQTEKESMSIFGKIKKGLSSKWGIGAIIGVIVLALSYLIVKAIKKYSSESAKIRGIIEKDINPIIFQIAQGIIRRKVRSTSQIDEMIADLNEAIVKKNFSQRDWSES